MGGSGNGLVSIFDPITELFGSVTDLVGSPFFMIAIAVGGVIALMVFMQMSK